MGDHDRAAAQRGRVLPALPEDRLDVVHRRPADRGLDVVPGRGGAVLVGHGVQRLRVAAVRRVVAARVAQVDAADVGDVPARVVAVPDHHQLLVVGAAGAHPHVEDHLGPAPLQGPAELGVLPGGEADRAVVRAPHEPAHVDPPLVGAAQHLDDLAAGLAGQPLVGVALPVGEEHQVAGTRRLEPLVELGEVGRSVDQGPDAVALRPGPVARVLGVEAGGRVAPLGLGEEPVLGCAHPRTVGAGGPWAGERGTPHRPQVVRRVRARAGARIG